MREPSCYTTTFGSSPASYLVGAPLSGRLSDRIVVQWRRARGGVWYPEDRLRAAISGALFFVPLSMLLTGFITEYIGGPIGLTLVFMCLFVNGFGVGFQRHRPLRVMWWITELFQLELVLSPAAAYVVDVLHSRSAEAVAANK